MGSGLRVGSADALAVLSLIGTAIVIALPVLTGGHLTYIDNSVHLAEVYDLARRGSTGWSEIAFGGFPLSTLHSPLWYGALVFLTRHGAPLEVLYRGALVLGFVAPALSLYRVARRRAGAVPSAVLAYLLLVQSTMIWGIGSPLGGMWTHTLSTAGVILLVDLYSRPALSLREHWVASVILALTVLTHLFVLPVVAILVVLTTVLHRRSRAMSDREARLRLLGWAVAALASARYWLTLVLVGDDAAAPHQNFGPLELLCRLALPSDAMYLLEGQIRESLRADAFFLDALPMLLVIGLGVYGYVKSRQAEDELARVSIGLAVLIFGFLVIDRYFPIRQLGPVTFRLIEAVRTGLALAAIPGLASFPLERWFRGRRVALLAAAGVVLGVLWGAPLRHDNPRERLESELADVERLWTWLEGHAERSWGRLYVQDTFGQDWQHGGIALSHVLSLTPRHTGLPQLGPYYGVIPFRLRWTLSEFNSLYTTREPSRAWLLEAMDKTNAGALVTSNEGMTAHVEDMDAFDRLHSVGRFTVFRRRDAKDHPIAELSPANQVGSVAWSPDEIRFSLETEYPNSRVLAKTSFHKWWHLEGIPRAWLRESPEGFLVIDDIPRGRFQVRLWYAPGAGPGILSVIGVALLCAWGLVVRAAARRGKPSAA